MKSSRTWAAVFLNLILGNVILVVTLTSNVFLSSLLFNFKLDFLMSFSICSVVSITAVGHVMERRRKRISKFFWALSLTAAPVLISCWLVIGYAFLKSDNLLQKALFVLQFGSLVALTAGAFYWVPLGLINFYIFGRFSEDSERPELSPRAGKIPILLILVAACLAIGSFLTVTKRVSTSERTSQLQAKVLEKAKVTFLHNVVDCAIEKETGINDTLYEESRFAALFPRLNFYGKSHKYSRDLTIYFTAKGDDLFRRFIEITYGGKTSVVDTRMNAEDYSGVVVDNVLYLAWLLGPEKGHLQPEDDGKIYLMAFDLAQRKELYRRPIYTGSADIRDSSLGYFPRTKELVLAFELLNDSDYILVGKIPVSAIGAGLDVDVNPSKIELQGFNVQHQLPRFFTSAGQLYYFSSVESKAFIILKIDEALTAKERYLLNPDRDPSPAHNPIVISREMNGDLKIYEDRFERPPVRCRKIAIGKILKL